ncbi:DNA gyrase inhibitor YacG [Methylobacterium sp. JK268]
MAEPVTPKGETPASAPCPICGRPAAEAFRPFCSKRCADVDLQRWLSGRYAIPGRAEDAAGPGDDDEG